MVGLLLFIVIVIVGAFIAVVLSEEMQPKLNTEDEELERIIEYYKNEFLREHAIYGWNVLYEDVQRQFEERMGHKL